jgi:hypothetical protein
MPTASGRGSRLNVDGVVSQVVWTPCMDRLVRGVFALHVPLMG